MKPIKKMLTKYNYYFAGNGLKYIVIHDVGTVSSAEANARYFGSGSRGASAHYFVDPDNIIQIIEDTDRAWHVGDNKGKSDITNNNSIGIEMCLVGDMSATIAHTIDLTAYLMAKHKIPLERVVRHYDASGKNCPASMSASRWTKWIEFKARLASKLKGGTEMDDKQLREIIRDEVGKIFGGFVVHEVKQGDITLGQYTTIYAAIAEAKKWAGSTITQNGKVIWAFENLYRVVQGKGVLGNFDELEEAKTEARKWAGSEIIQKGKVVWKFGDK